MSIEQTVQYPEITANKKHVHTGLQQNEEAIRSIWNDRVVVVAGDGASFEVRPNRDHEWNTRYILLPGYWIPIGEMFNLERLVEMCKKLKRWTFSITSSPLNH